METDTRQCGLRVCVASSGLGHVARGIEAWAADLGKALTRRGVDVSLCKGGGGESGDHEKRLWCLQREGRTTSRLLSITPRRFLWRLGLGSPYEIEQTSFALGLVRHLRRRRADILHVQDPQLALLIQRARSVGLVRTRTILAHGTEEPPEFLKRIEFLQHLAPFHAESARNAGIWRPNWTTIPNFIDTEFFSPGPRGTIREELQIPADALIVLCVAAIKRSHKRIDYLLREFEALVAANSGLPVWLVVAGGWEKETDELIACGKTLLGDRVRFLVRFPRQRIPDLYRSADVFVLTSLFEMMPIALLEAQGSGLPCIVHDHANLKWATGPGALAADLSLSGNLAIHLKELLLDPHRRETMAAEARRYCSETFSEPTVMSQITDYYQRITSQR